MSTQPIDVVVWIEDGQVQIVTSSISNIRVFVADADNFHTHEDLEDNAVDLSLDGRQSLYELVEHFPAHEDTSYIHDAMERIRYAQHLADEYGPANQPHYDATGYVMPPWVGGEAVPDPAIEWMNNPKR